MFERQTTESVHRSSGRENRYSKRSSVTWEWEATSAFALVCVVPYSVYFVLFLCVLFVYPITFRGIVWVCAKCVRVCCCCLVGLRWLRKVAPAPNTSRTGSSRCCCFACKFCLACLWLVIGGAHHLSSRQPSCVCYSPNIGRIYTLIRTERDHTVI